MQGFGAYVWQVSSRAIGRTLSRARTWLFIIVVLALPAVHLGFDLEWQMSESQSLALALLAIVGGFVFEWMFAAFDIHREQKSEIAALTPIPGGDRRERIATAFCEVLHSANQIFHDGTVGCRDGRDADAWLPKYEVWLREAKDRITRDAGENECTAVFFIAGDSIRGLEQINGHNSEATRALTFLKHYIGQLKKGLERNLLIA